MSLLVAYPADSQHSVVVVTLKAELVRVPVLPSALLPWRDSAPRMLLRVAGAEPKASPVDVQSV